MSMINGKNLRVAVKVVRNKGEKSPEEKANDIHERIENSLDKELVAKAFKEDHKLHNLFVDLEKAEKRHAYLSVSIIKKQQDARGKEIISNIANKKLDELVVNGGIIDFMEDEDKHRFNAARGRMFLAYQMLDSALLDLEGTIRSCGIYGEVAMVQSLAVARKDINDWACTTLDFHGDKAKEMVMDEGDRLYDHLKERTEVLCRKLNRQNEKEEKAMNTKQKDS